MNIEQKKSVNETNIKDYIIKDDNMKDLQIKLNTILVEYGKKIDELQNQLEIEKSERIKENKEMSSKITSLENEIDSVKNKIYIIQIRDKIKNFIKSFYYILEPDEKAEIETKSRKRSEVFSKAFDNYFKLYKGKKSFCFLKEILLKASDLYDLGNILAHTLYSKNHKVAVEKFIKKKNINEAMDPDKVLFLSLCDLPDDYLKESITFIKNVLDNDFRKCIIRGEDIYMKFLRENN